MGEGLGRGWPQAILRRRRHQKPPTGIEHPTANDPTRRAPRRRPPPHTASPRAHPPAPLTPTTSASAASPASPPSTTPANSPPSSSAKAAPGAAATVTTPTCSTPAPRRASPGPTSAPSSSSASACSTPSSSAAASPPLKAHSAPPCRKSAHSASKSDCTPAAPIRIDCAHCSRSSIGSGSTSKPCRMTTRPSPASPDSGQRAWESLDVLLTAHVPMEVRTTLMPDWTPEQIATLAHALADAGVKNYCVQACDSSRALDETLGPTAMLMSERIGLVERERFGRFVVRGS